MSWATLDLSRRNLLINREIGDRRSEAIALSNLGVAWLELGDLAQARRDSQESLRMLRANGDRVIEGSTLCNLSDLALMHGDAAFGADTGAFGPGHPGRDASARSGGGRAAEAGHRPSWQALGPIVPQRDRPRADATQSA